MDIEFKDGSVCYADGEQWFVNTGADSEKYQLVNLNGGRKYSFYGMHGFSMDFQLNTIKKGDFISAVNISNKRTFNKMVEVFGLFGYEFEHSADAVFYSIRSEQCIYTTDDGLMFCGSKNGKRRELLVNQVEAIGELKRLEIERKRKEVLSPKGGVTVKQGFIKSNFSEKPNSCEDEKPPYHIERDGDKYHREIVGLDGTKTTVDVYRVLDAFKTGCAATDHAIKKMLCAGLRGHKDKLTDYDNAIESLQAAKELTMQKSSNENTN